MRWELLVCDLDGTLVDKKTGIDPALVDGFHRAREHGLLVSLATGRMPPGAESSTTTGAISERHGPEPRRPGLGSSTRRDADRRPPCLRRGDAGARGGG